MSTLNAANYEHVFNRLGYTDENGKTLMLRTKLLLVLKSEIESNGWNQRDAAQRLGVKQPRISEIISLRIDKFSVELLIKYLMRIGKEVTFSVGESAQLITD